VHVCVDSLFTTHIKCEMLVSWPGFEPMIFHLQLLSPYPLCHTTYENVTSHNIGSTRNLAFTSYSQLNMDVPELHVGLSSLMHLEWDSRIWTLSHALTHSALKLMHRGDPELSNKKSTSLYLSWFLRLKLVKLEYILSWKMCDWILCKLQKSKSRMENFLFTTDLYWNWKMSDLLIDLTHFQSETLRALLHVRTRFWDMFWLLTDPMMPCIKWCTW
jgi:hypothetical protein